MIKLKSKKVKKLLDTIMGGNQSSNHRSTGHTPPANYDMPPLNFHTSHGDNITLSNDGAVATRRESYCKGVLFSHRPVIVGERVCLKICNLSTRWSGVIRVGFSAHDPTNLQGRLPKYACPDLTNKNGYWAKALPDRSLETNAVIHYYVSSHGEVHFGINGGDLGVFFTGIDTRQPLWALIDLYGNCTEIELVDSRRSMNNFSNRSTSARSSLRDHQRPWPNVPTHQIMPTSVALPPLIPPAQSVQNVHQPVHSVQATPQNVQDLTRQISNVTFLSNTPSPPPQQPRPRRQETNTAPTSESNNLDIGTVPTLKYNQGIRFQAMTFHTNLGKNVKLDGSATVAVRHVDEFAQGYVFSRHTITPGERLVVQVLANEDSYIGSLAFGLTNCDPGTFDASLLPEDSDLLLDRPEYWVVSKDVANSPAQGDELSFTIKTDGSVEFMRNNAIPSIFMHVDITQPLWAFWDIYGNTSRIRILGSCQQSLMRTSLPRQQSNQQLVQVETPTTNGTLNAASAVVPETDTLNTSTSSQNTTECIVCYEKAVDCVIYTCGHMCLCYECGLQQWRGRGAGICPMCRMPIRDIIRTYRN